MINHTGEANATGITEPPATPPGFLYTGIPKAQQEEVQEYVRSPDDGPLTSPEKPLGDWKQCTVCRQLRSHEEEANGS